MRSVSHHSSLLAIMIVALLLALLPPAPRAAATTSTQPPTDRLIVKYRPGSGIGTQAAPAPAEIAALASALGGEQLAYLLAGGNGTHVLALPEARAIEAVEDLARRIAASPDVEYAEPDYRVFADLTPTDPLYATYNWHLQAVSSTNYGANLPTAWDVTTGSSSIVVAIIDTGGLLTHEDLTGRNLVTNPGYDMISSENTAQDGADPGGVERDADPSDPGDWVPSGAGCTIKNSSWHGSHVAGTIGASANNGKGITGINWVSPLLHLRALGRCGGNASDVTDAMLWAAGEPISGLPTNPNPARVLNLSLGSEQPCTTTYQNAINTITAKGVVIVVAAGNSNKNASGFNPASCNGVITVAATTWSGNRADYSNFGSLVEIAAPGGGRKDITETAKGIASSINSGTQGPVADAYGLYQGTSMAAPHVAGIVSLMLAANPALTNAEVLSIIQSTATAFPAGSTCLPVNTVCGAGIINAGAAVEEAARRVRTASFASASQSVAEAAGTITLPITLPIKSNKTVTVPFTVGGTATGTDHNLVAGTLTYPAGTTTQNISFAITNDAAAEPSETIVITLGTPTNAVLGATTTHTLTILDEDIVLAPGVGLSTTSVNFGSQQTGTTSATSNVTLTNNGTASLSLSNIAVSASDFTRSGGTCASVFPASLAPGASCTVLLTFSPVGLGAQNGSLTFTSNAAGSPHAVALSGTGVSIATAPEINLSTTSVTFGSQNVGSTSIVSTLTITNNGTGALNISALSISGSTFARSGGTCPSVFPTNLASAASCTVLLTFTPNAGGLNSGTLTIVTNAADSPHSVSLSGNGQYAVFLPLTSRP